MFTISSSKYKRVQFHLHLCNFCSCTCKEFRKTKILCKHIIAVVLVGKKTFMDLSVLYLEHPLPNLEKDLFQNFQENEGPKQLDIGNSGTFLTHFCFRPCNWCVYKEDRRRGSFSSS